MERITIYRHEDCAKCRRMARAHRLLDWLGRVRTSTDTPKTGPLRLGEIAVEEIATGETFKGVDAVRRICRNIPAYVPLLPFLRIPGIARLADREAGGCEDGACGVAEEGSKASG